MAAAGAPLTAKRAIVVGGGIGGLVTAGRLAKEGFTVTLLEQNEHVGGRCQSVTLSAPLPAGAPQYTAIEGGSASGPTSTSQPAGNEGSFRFDTGPSLLLFPDTYRETYRSLGQDMASHVELRRVEPAAYRVFHEGGGHMDMLYDVQQMMAQLEAVEPGAGSNYLAWLTSSRVALEAGISAFIARDFDGPLGLLDLRVLLPLLPRLNVMELLGQHHSRLALKFKDERLRAMFTFQDLYVGLSPYNAPGAFSLLAATELTDGVWYPIGGFSGVRDSLASIAEGLGVQIRTGTRVTAIDTVLAGSGSVGVTGVKLEDGERLPADVVVANRDLPLAYGLLEGAAKQYGQQRQAQISNLKYSAGVIAFNWCITQTLPRLLHHNVFLSVDREAAWAPRASAPEGLCHCPNFYVHVPSRTDPTAAPMGCESVMVLLPVANLQEMSAAGVKGEVTLGAVGGEAAEASEFEREGSSSHCAKDHSNSTAGRAGVRYSFLVEAGRRAVLRAFREAGVFDGTEAEFLSRISKEMVIDPEEWAARYGLQHGAAFGLSHGLDQLAVMRPAPKDAHVKGLYFVGASTRPGNGVPLVMIGADLMVKRVIKDVQAGQV